MGPHFIWKLKSVFGLNLLLLKTENWKHYSKIIFKCVNSIVGSFLIFFNTWTVINSAYTVNPCEVTVHVQEKKKKNVDMRKRASQTATKCMFGSTFLTHVCVLRFCFCFFFFFFFTRFGKTQLLFMYCSMNSNRKCWLFCSKQCIMYCSWTHKFHFLATFSLKMSLTVLFTHLKIILLQWFQ